MDSIRDELDEIIDGAFVSSYSFVAREVFLSIIATLIIGLIGPYGYGVITTIQKSIGAIRTIFGGIYVGLHRTIPRQDDIGKNTIVVSALFLVLCLLIVSVSLILGFEETVKSSIFNENTQDRLLYSSIGFLSAFLLMLYTNEVLKAYKKIPQANAVLQWISPILQILALFFVSLFVTMSVFKVITTLSIAFASTAILGVLMIVSYTTFNPIKLDFRSDAIKSYLIYVLAATGGSLFAGIQFTTPNVLLIIIPSEQAGAFGVSIILSNIVRIPLNSINQIYPQVATRLYKEDKIQEVNLIFKRTSKIAVFLTTYPALIISVYHNEIASLFSPIYEQYSIIIPIMIIGQIFAVLIGTVGLLIMMTDNEKGNIPVQFFLMVFTVIVSYYLTTEYGVFGLSIAYTIGLSINNFVELAYLYYSEKLMSLTKNHAYILISYVSFLLASLLVKNYTQIAINLPVSIVLSIIFAYVNFNYILDEVEREVLAEKFFQVYRRAKRI